MSTKKCKRARAERLVLRFTRPNREFLGIGKNEGDMDLCLQLPAAHIHYCRLLYDMYSDTFSVHEHFFQ